MRVGLALAATLLAPCRPAVAQADRLAVTLHSGTPVPLVTVDALSSRTHAKGDMVALRTGADVTVDGVVVIPRGTQATGQVEESRDTGGMGMNGKLTVRPLYLRLGDRIVRLTGAVANTGKTKADTVIGMVLLTPLLSGRSAVIPAGTTIGATVEKTTRL